VTLFSKLIGKEGGAYEFEKKGSAPDSSKLV